MKVEYKSQPLKQNWDQELPKYWFDNSPFKTHFMNALSIMIPVSEYIVLHTLKETQPLLTDLELKAQVSHMIAQENWHSFSHKKYNIWLERMDLPAVELSSNWLVSIISGKKKADKMFGASFWLPVIVAGEHSAACFMEYFLERPALLQQMHPHFRQAWLWHFIEEIEHKGSSMEMWHDTKQIYNRKKWKLNLAHLVQGVRFHSTVLQYTFTLLNRDKQLWKWKTFKDGMSFIFGRDGLFFNTAGQWCRLFGKNFNPWDHDTRYLIAQYQKIIDVEAISPERLQEIEEEFKGCVADTEAIIAENNKKSDNNKSGIHII